MPHSQEDARQHRWRREQEHAAREGSQPDARGRAPD